MRRAAKTDATHAEIRDGLRKLGCSVFDTHALGRDFPDLVVGLAGETYLVEVKTPKLISGRKPKETIGQMSARRGWRGGAWIVAESLLHAVRTLGLEHRLVDELGKRGAVP